MCVWHYRVNLFGKNKPIEVFSTFLEYKFIESLNNKMKNKWFAVRWVGWYDSDIKSYYKSYDNEINWFDGTKTYL